MSKQTAVEWLIEQIIKYELVPKGTNPDNVLFHKAKEMHKQEIVDAINLPSEKRWYNALLYNNSGEQYYNKTYVNT
jgi:hypothetical protein